MEIFGSLVLSFLISYVSIPSIIRVAQLKHLYDDPDDYICSRKIHSSKVPTLGGVAIFAGFLMSFSFFGVSETFYIFRYLIVALTIIFFTGVKDDILILVAKKKLLSQTLAACVVIHWGGVKLTSLYGLFGIYGIPEWASYFLSFATVLGLINSFNLIDGVDLLAGSLGCLSILFFSSWLMTYVDVAWGVLGFSAIGAILGFLIYNRPPAKIFMGDTGAMIIGLLVAVLTIKFVEANRLQTIIRSGPSIAFAAICVPVFDTLRLIIVRVMQGQSPFCADKNHIHHLLLNCGFNHLQVTLTLLSLNFGLLLFAYNFDYFKIEGRWASEVLLSILISVYGIFVSVVSKTSAREKNTTTS